MFYISMEQRIADILSAYRDTAKPLLADIESRRGKSLPDNCLNEIRALNDHIARCYRRGITEQSKNSELTKAEGHLRRLIYDCFKQLNIYISDTLNRKEKRYYSDTWLTHNEGQFWKEYSLYRRNAQQNVIEAKRNESYDSDKAMESYEAAFQNYRMAEELLNNNHRMLLCSLVNKYWQLAGHASSWLLITLVLSLIASLIGLFCQ